MSGTDRRVWKARQNILSVWEDARDAENEVLADELEDIEHRLCLITQLVQGDERIESCKDHTGTDQ